MRPARRARAGGRPCIHLFRRSRAYSDPCAAAALCACGRDVAEGGGSGHTWRSAHRQQGRAAVSGGSASGGRRYLDACGASWLAAAATPCEAKASTVMAREGRTRLP